MAERLLAARQPSARAAGWLALFSVSLTVIGMAVDAAEGISVFPGHGLALGALLAAFLLWSDARDRDIPARSDTSRRS